MSRSLALLLGAALFWGACASDEGAASAEPALADGDYFVGIRLQPFGIQLRLEVAVDAEVEKGKPGQIAQMELRVLATSASDPWRSEVIATLQDIPVDASGAFVADFGKVNVPGQGIPTGTDTEVLLVFHARIDAEGTSFCGDITGEVPTFKAKLDGSTFKAVPAGTEPSEGFDVACAKKIDKRYDPIATCPALAAGDNMMTSADLERTFIVKLPSTATATDAKLPVVFLFHGVGGSAKGFLKESAFEAQVEAGGFILVVPDSATIDGKKALLDWLFSDARFDRNNRDLVFFDDTLKCLAQTWPVDPKRVYVTGMSGGGLISTFIGAWRADKVAAAAPFSGGYLHAKWPEDKSKTPFMVSWGGPKDFSFQQDFDKLAKALIGMLESAEHPVVRCNHGLEHKWPPTGAADAWTFLRQFTLGGGEQPSLAGLPAYCK